jgi:hypothetical protein
MGEVDRRGFMRILRRSDPAAKEAEAEVEAPELSAKDRQIRELADLTASLLADVASEGEEPLAEAALRTGPWDLTYMRVTDQHIVFSIVTGFSVFLNTGDVRRFDTEPPVEVSGHGQTVVGVIHAHHAADPESVTRSHSFRFPADSPLPAAIRTACNLPEPEEPEEPEEEAAGELEPEG